MDVFKALVFFLCCAGTQAASGEVYRWIDEKGRTHFSDQAPPSRQNDNRHNSVQARQQALKRKEEQPPVPTAARPTSKSNDILAPGKIILTLRKLLQENRFADLNRILHAFQTALERDISTEEAYFTAYKAFDISDAAYLAHFKSWVAATPNQYQPYAARAQYYYRLGWAARGTKWASETEAARITEMNEYFAKALRDIDKALSLNRKSLVPHALKLRIANTQGRSGCKLGAISVHDENERDTLIQEFRTGLRDNKDDCIVLLVIESEDLQRWTIAGYDDDEKFQRETNGGPDDALTRALKRNPVDETAITRLAVSRLGRSYEENDTLHALEAALQVYPASYEVRAHYMNALTPRWGGSHAAMEKFARDALKFAGKNPRLRMLEGLIYADAADSQSLVKKYKDADALYTKALAYGLNHRILKERAENNYRRKRYEDALNDLERAIEAYQEDAEYYYWRSKAHASLEQYDKAAQDIAQASLLKPEDTSIQAQRQWLVSQLSYLAHKLNEQRQSSAAIEMFDTALALDPGNADIHYWRARAYLNQNQLKPAFQDLDQAITLNSGKYEYYQLIDWVLAQHRDWKRIIAYWDRYIALNPEDDRAYVERGGAYYRMGDMKSAVANAKIAADMGNPQGKEAYERFGPRVR